MIRLSALQSAGRELEQWMRTMLPFAVFVVVLVKTDLCAGFSRSHYMALFLGWQLVRSYQQSDSDNNNNKNSSSREVSSSNSNSTNTNTILIQTNNGSNNATSHNQDTLSLADKEQRQHNSASAPPMQHYQTTTATCTTTCTKEDENVDGMDYLTTGRVPTAVLANICGYLPPQQVTRLASVNRAAVQQFGDSTIWKELWFRDYGRALLQWNIGRQVLSESLQEQEDDDDEEEEEPTHDSSLQARLSRRLDRLHTRSNASSQYFMRDFYFVFGEIYVNYLLAGRNNVEQQNCYLGLHGHLLDFSSFAQFHPGLTESVLVHCGQDATEIFESLPHSRGARSAARQLVVVMNRSCVGSPEDCGYGLLLKAQPSTLHQLLRASNSRPLQDGEGVPPSTNTTSSTAPTVSKAMLKQLLPAQPHSPLRRPPTLARVRSEWDKVTKIQEQNAATAAGKHWRVYFDPLCQQWLMWNADPENHSQ